MHVPSSFRFSSSFFKYTIALGAALGGLRLGAVDYYLGSSAGRQPGVAVDSIAELTRLNLQPGDRVLFQGGETFTGTLWLLAEDSGTPKQPIVVTSFGKGRATLNGGDSHAIGIHNAGGIVIRDLNLAGRDPRTNGGAGVWVRSERRDSGKSAFLRLENLQISRFRDGVEIGAWPTGGARAWPGYEDVQMRGLEVFDNRNDGIAVWGAWHEGQSGNYSHRNVTVADSQVYNNPGDPNEDKQTGSGIVLGGVDRGLIERCVAHDNGGQGPAKGGGPFGIWVWESRGITIQHNLVYNQRSSSDQDGGAFDLDGGATQCVVQYNVSYGNAGPGLAMLQFPGATAQRDNVIRFNLSENDARANPAQGALCVGPGAGAGVIGRAQVYGNTIFVSATQKRARPPAVFVAREGLASEVDLRNNVFHASHNGPLIADPMSDPKRVRYQGNNYWGGSFNLDTFRRSGQELLGGRKTGRRQDPAWQSTERVAGLRSAAALGTVDAYRLSSRSPLIGGGVDLRSVGVDAGPRDFFGREIPPGPPAIGADAAGPSGRIATTAPAGDADRSTTAAGVPGGGDAAAKTMTVQSAQQSPTPLVTAAAAAAAPAALRINAGGKAYTDPAGNRWSADTGYNTGRTASVSSSIAGTEADPLYRTERYDSSSRSPNLRYSLAVPNGSYTLRLHFAETHDRSKKVGGRIFDVKVEGALVLDNLDIFKEVGGNRALIKSVPVTVRDGRLDVEFFRGTQNPTVSAMELTATATAPVTSPVTKTPAPAPNPGTKTPAPRTDTTAPTAPGGVRAGTVTSSSVALSWNASADNVGVGAYDVKRNGAVVKTLTSTTRSFTDTGLRAATSYTYQIVARDAAGNSAASSSLKVTTRSGAATTAKLTLAWDDNATNETGFKIERSTNGTSFSQIATVGSNVRSYTDTGLAVGVPYWYRVRAYNATGHSTYSNTTSATTRLASVDAPATTERDEAVVTLQPSVGPAAGLLADGKPDRRQRQLGLGNMRGLVAEGPDADVPEQDKEEAVAE